VTDSGRSLAHDETYGSIPSAWDTAVSTSGPSHFRPDIEGLRAIAIGAVLLFHAGIPGMDGGFIGVDVFFVISGFLITGLLVRDIAKSGRVDFASFYARRARRLLPAALVVVAVTVAASYFILSSVDFPPVAGDGTAAALYVSNYRFALTATDYFAQDVPPSPLLHYWSLGVEEQFYLFWPLLTFVGVRLLGVRRLWWLISAVALGSFVLSVYVTNVEAPWAFYSLPTRAWQLALGALIALEVLNLPRRFDWRMASVVGAAGLALIVAGVLLINDTVPFPGFVALLPAGGAALLIVSGERAGALTARVLAMRPMRWVGRISYSLYLWHWPILILVPQLIGRHGLITRVGLAIGAVIVAELSTRYVEAPFRFGRTARLTSRRTLAISGTASLAVAASLWLSAGGPGLTAHATTLPTLPPESSVEPALPIPVLTGLIPRDLQPSLLNARADRAKITFDGCQTPITDPEPRDCVYGDPAGTTTAVLFGDSHAGMWLPAIEPIALERHWRLVPFVKPACTLADVTVWRIQLERPLVECTKWREQVLDRIAQIRPDLLIVTSSLNYRIVGADGQPEKASSDLKAWAAGMRTTLDRLRAMTDRLVLIQETPHHARDPVACLADADRVDECIDPRSKMVNDRYAALEEDLAAESEAQIVRVLDWLCLPSTCPPILGQYLVYRDNGHLTATMATVFAARFRWALDHG